MTRIRSMLMSGVMIATSFLAFGASPASANDPGPASLQEQIDAQLRAAPGGVQINDNQIAWEGGSVIMTFPSAGEVATNAVADCPNAWFCFWQHANFEGRRLQFSDCGRQDLGDYAFRNQASSWHNHTNSWINVWQLDLIDDLLWQEPPGNTRSSYVGRDDNDRADYFDRDC